MQHDTPTISSVSAATAPSSGSINAPTYTSRAKDTIAGTVAGIACLYTGHPFDTTKVRMQMDDANKYKGPFNCMMRIGREEGIRSLFKGATPSLVSMMLENGILFLAYGQIKDALLRTRKFIEGDSATAKTELSLLELGLAGSLSSFFSSFALCPTELIKCRLQADPNAYKGPVDCTVRTVKAEGFRGLFRGLTGTLYREMPGNFAFFGAYEATRYLLTKKGESVSDLGPLGLMFAGGLGGVAFWSLVYPFDTVKTHLQVENAGKNREFRSFWGTTRQIIQAQGFASLYRGVGITLWRAFPSNAALFLTYELTRKYL